MADREEIVGAINNFIKTKDLNAVLQLVEYLCDVREIKLEDKDTLFRALENPMILSMILNQTIEELERHYKLVRLSSKVDPLILVY